MSAANASNPPAALDPKPSPWHAGERTLQERLGVAERMDVVGRRVIRDFMPDQHRTFYRQLPFIVVGAVDADGAVWATLLEGRPGFMSSPDPRVLRIDSRAAPGDPTSGAMDIGAPIGLLGIELHTRRRNRMNGRVTQRDGRGFEVTVEHSFGNCPQYIQARQAYLDIEPAPRGSDAGERAAGLDEADRAMIRAADTFFVASYADIDGDASRRSVDVSHRGGKAGFVRVDGDVLTIPDFAGNLHFNTLGNLLLNPRAGLVFIDFERGDLLHLTGSAEIVFEGPETMTFQGAERLWRFKVERVVRRRGALASRFRPGEVSPNSRLTGSWEEAEAKAKAEALRGSFRPFRVLDVVEESSAIRSFVLGPADGAGVPLFQPGQHLPVRLYPKPEAAPILRTYTISTAPSDGKYRITVKRQGVASRYLHDCVKIGDILEVRSPQGNFTADVAEKRPIVLISGGVGITPMISLLRHIVYEGLRTRRMRSTWFLHSSRTRAERPFDAELRTLAEAAGENLHIIQALSAPEAESLAPHERHGRIDVDLLRSVLPFDDYDFFLCGPAAMTQGLYDALRALRIPDDRIHAEAFGPSALKRKPDLGVKEVRPLPMAATTPVPVLFARSATEARWNPGEGALLDLAESRGLSPEFSCRGGSCGTCKVRLLEGEVTYDSPPGADHAPDEALICCAIPAEASPRIVLDL